jgi:hypothetical protein
MGCYSRAFHNRIARTESEKVDRFEYTISDYASEATRVMGDIVAVQRLPERNRRLLARMARFMLATANDTFESDCTYRWKQNYWGLYMIGSRSYNAGRADSDLDLMSVGTFFTDLSFHKTDLSLDETEPVFDDFDTQLPQKLPDNYNIGEVDRAYLIRATPHHPDALPVDLKVVDLTFVHGNLNYFKQVMDTDEQGKCIHRIPLIELFVDQAKRPTAEEEPELYETPACT